jgi:hypothetical protein
VGWPCSKDVQVLCPQNVMERRLGGRRSVREHRGRWEDAVWRVAVNLLQIRKWKASARRKEIGEATARSAIQE